MSKKKTTEKNNFFEKNLENFIKNIDSLETLLHLSMGLILLKYKMNFNKLFDFIKKNAKKRTSKSFTLKYEDIDYYKKLKRNLDISNISLKVVPRSTLISLVSQFDAFMSLTIKIVLLSYPGILNNCEKSLTFSLLSNFNNIDEAKNYIIEKEIDSVLRESHIYHFEWLESKLGITLRKDLAIWQVFVELTERRNLFAHCGGKISSQYMAICKENGVNLNKEYKIGYEIDISPQYLDSAYKCLYELSVKLTHVIWRKLKPNELDIADENLNKICYNLINEEAYPLADILLEFATATLKKYFNESSSNCFIINKALSKKLGGDKKTAYQIVNSKDWSASSNDFKLAKEVILDNNENVFLLMKKIGKEGECINKANYRIWPLFKELKKNKKFQETFKQIYKEEYELKENRLEYDFKFTVKPKKKVPKK
ncbi:MAG: hypothetical protein Q8N21_04180 [bacterium]|nr:hypothetical protein [bacterium]